MRHRHPFEGLVEIGLDAAHHVPCHRCRSIRSPTRGRLSASTAWGRPPSAIPEVSKEYQLRSSPQRTPPLWTRAKHSPVRCTCHAPASVPLPDSGNRSREPNSAESGVASPPCLSTPPGTRTTRVLHHRSERNRQGGGRARLPRIGGFRGRSRNVGLSSSFFRGTVHQFRERRLSVATIFAPTLFRKRE